MLRLRAVTVDYSLGDLQSVCRILVKQISSKVGILLLSASRGNLVYFCYILPEVCKDVAKYSVFGD